jgi:hypothetical protein
MKLSIQLYLAASSRSNSVSLLDVFGIDWIWSPFLIVHKADLQPESDRGRNHIAVDETVIQLDDEQCWLYAAVDPDSNDLLHINVEPTRTNVIADPFFPEFRENTR